MIPLTVPPYDIMNREKGELNLFSNGLDGTMLAGQSQSLDLVFGNNVLAEIRSSGNFAIVLSIFSSSSCPTITPWADTTGYMLDEAGHQLDPTYDFPNFCAGGTFIPGLPFLSLGPDGIGIGRLSGIHLDVVYPTTGGTVILACGLSSMTQPLLLNLGLHNSCPNPPALSCSPGGSLVSLS
jgi:hypothetical protein